MSANQISVKTSENLCPLKHYSHHRCDHAEIWNRRERESILIVRFGVKFLGLFMYEFVDGFGCWICDTLFFLHVWICVDGYDGFGYRFGILFVEKEKIWGWKVFCVVLWMKMKHKWRKKKKRKECREEERKDRSWKPRGKFVISLYSGYIKGKKGLQVGKLSQPDGFPVTRCHVSATCNSPIFFRLILFLLFV